MHPSDKTFIVLMTLLGLTILAGMAIEAWSDDQMARRSLECSKIEGAIWAFGECKRK